MRVAGRSILFAIIALLVSALLDLALWGGYQGFEPQAERESLLLTHAALLGALFLVSFVASVGCFAALRRRLPSVKAVAILALLFGLVAPFAATAATASLGVAAGALVLLAIALVIVGFGGFAFGPKRG